MTHQPVHQPADRDVMQALAEELREYTAFKYAGNCKCGKCQLVPRELVDRLYAALSTPPIAQSDREAIARIIDPVAWTAQDKIGKFVTYVWGIAPSLEKADAILALRPIPAGRAAIVEADEDEAFEIGKRDGYEDAVQDFDLATGGDGEFKGSTIPGDTVDMPTMKARILERINGIRDAAQALIDDVDKNHDTKAAPQKYGVPYGAVNRLRRALSGEG